MDTTSTANIARLLTVRTQKGPLIGGNVALTAGFLPRPMTKPIILGITGMILTRFMRQAALFASCIVLNAVLHKCELILEGMHSDLSPR